MPGILGNIPASGTEIIKELGEEHVRSGKPIVYPALYNAWEVLRQIGVACARETAPPARSRAAIVPKIGPLKLARVRAIPRLKDRAAKRAT